MIRVIVAGSRTFRDQERLSAVLDGLFGGETDVTVISGCAAGADTLGERWAADRGHAVETYPAAWGEHGRAAGPIRNQQMVDAADRAVFFWDGKSPGTRDCVERASKKGIPVLVCHG